MTILVSGGDSFIWGSELQDDLTDSPIPSQYTMTALLAKENNLTYSCAAWPGNANNAISRMTMSTCHELLQTNEKFCVVIMWTFFQRYEFRFGYNTNQKLTPWRTIGAWECMDDVSKITDWFTNDNHWIAERHATNLTLANANGVVDFAKTFFKHVGDNEYYELYTSLKEILFMQQYLTANDIPYLFIPADWDANSYARNSDIFMQTLYESIDWRHWYFFPAGNGAANQTNAPRGFYQWAKENKYRIGTTHPLEDAHYDASLLIQEKFDELVAKHL